MGDPTIIRNERKINAIIKNAKAIARLREVWSSLLKFWFQTCIGKGLWMNDTAPILQEENLSFADFLWSLLPNQTTIIHPVRVCVKKDTI